MDDLILAPEEVATEEHELKISADFEQFKLEGRDFQVRLFLEDVNKLYNQFTDDVVSLGKKHGFCVKAETVLSLN